MNFDHIGHDTRYHCQTCNHHHCIKCGDCHRCGCPTYVKNRTEARKARNNAILMNAWNKGVPAQIGLLRYPIIKEKEPKRNKRIEYKRT